MGIGSLSRSINRRLSQPNFINRYFVGVGIDIGGKPDPLALYKELFSNMTQIYTWGVEEGDAQFMEGVGDEQLDFVHSSHCLEHINDPKEAISNWIRILKPGGYLIVTVPDEDLYEQGVFPSSYSQGHLWTFTMLKEESWSPQSVNILDLVRPFANKVSVEKIELLDQTYRYELPRYDQTVTPIGECGIEIILRKKKPDEIEKKGNINKPQKVTQQMAHHLNGYVEDVLLLNDLKMKQYLEKQKQKQKENGDEQEQEEKKNQN